jgi:hypothetical protein
MRITVSHNKGKQEAIRIVDGAVDQALGPMFSGALRMSNVQKRWNGSTMEFSLTAGLSAVRVPIKGSILVTENEITIDCDLPAFIERLLPESARSGVQAAIRGLLK